MYSHVYYAHDMGSVLSTMDPYKQHVSSSNHLAGLVQCFTQSVGNRLEGT